MAVLTSIIGAGMKAAGQIVGGIAQRRNMRALENSNAQRLADNQNWYDRNYNENALQMANTQRLLTMSEQNYKNRNRQAAATAAVMGGTEESIAAGKAAATAAQADTISQINAADVARKDNIDSQFRQTQNALLDAKDKLTVQKAAATQQAVMGLSDAAGNMNLV